MRTEELEVDDRFGPEYAGQYLFEEITWAKRSRIIQKHTKYHPVTGRVVRSDYVAIQAETIIAALKAQPKKKPITLEKLLNDEDGVPVALGERLSKAANRVCGLAREERKNSSGR